MFNKINIEITNVCSKKCGICGRREREKKYPNLYNKHMDFKLLKIIQPQLPSGCLIQFHNNGEPTEFPDLKEALQYFFTTGDFIRCFDTNGILLAKKSKEIINNCEVITISIIEKDPTWKSQLKILKEFLSIKQNKKPRVILRYVGEIEYIEAERDIEYKKLNLPIVYRQLHSPSGSFKYKKPCIKPEYMICYEMLNHPAIDVDGNFSVCVRFDPEKKGVIGNIKDKSIKELWYSNKRLEWLNHHIDGHREKVPLCSSCDYWGLPRGND